MPLVRETKTIGSKGRITISPDILHALNMNVGDKVYFEITKSGSLIIRKVKE